MKYYFDTSIWIAYFDETEFYHKEAVKWFEKVRNETLIASDVVDFELRKKFTYYEIFLNMFDTAQNLRFINSSKEDRAEAYNLSKTTEFGYGDLLHLLTAKRYDLISVTADIHHWPKIARMLGISNLKYVSDINP